MKPPGKQREIRRALSNFTKNCVGNISIVTVLTAIPIVAAVGIAIDYSRGSRVETKLQQIVDAAALAAAAARNISGSAEQKAGQRAAISRMHLDAGLAGLTDAEIVGSPSITVGPGAIDISVNAIVPGTLINVLNLPGAAGKTMSISVNAKAAFATAGMCLLSLEPGVTKAIEVISDSSIITPDCGVHINSTDSEALYANGGSAVLSSSICIVGDYATNSGSSATPAPLTDCAIKADPLAGLLAPPSASSACTYDDIVVQSVETRSFAPGVFCGKLEIKDGATVTFEPGIHVVRDTEFIINSGARVIAQNVMIYLQHDKSRMNFNGGSSIDLRAPATGAYAGIAVFQDRGAATAPHVINSNSASRIEGVVYLPNNDLHINSGSSFGQSSPWWAIIARKFHVNSNSIIHINVDFAASSAPVPPAIAGGGVRLTE